MTPIFGIVFAICAALLAPTLRSALMVELSLMATATAIQTWDLGAGLGSNPASTVREASYWIVQAIIVAVITALTAGIFVFRRRNARRSGRSLVRGGVIGHHGGVALAAGQAALVVVGLLIVVAVYSSQSTHGRGVGDIPASGVIGIVAGVVAVVALAVYAVIGARRTPA